MKQFTDNGRRIETKPLDPLASSGKLGDNDRQRQLKENPVPMATPQIHEWLELPAKDRVAAVGHRRYVGGADAEMWYGIGRLQYHYLVLQGLKHNQHFLDIACGALRLGQFLIPYLDRGCYFGLDEEPSLIDAALDVEIPAALVREKVPTFSFNSDFDFGFVKSFDVAWANSLVTHLGPEMATLLFRNLRIKAKDDSRFFFTYWVGDMTTGRAEPYHPNLDYRFLPEQLAEIGADTGWEMKNLGSWNHPRNQMMMLAMPRPLPV